MKALQKLTPAAPAERPILFTGAMVRAIISGKKTQTRRLVDLSKAAPRGATITAESIRDRVRCPYGAAGDRLWLRETWRAEEIGTIDSPWGPSGTDGVRFAADDAFVPIASTREAAEAWVVAYDNGRHEMKWRPSIYIPRWASRIALEVTGVRVERLQDITEADILAEGITVPVAAEMTGLSWSDIPTLHIAWEVVWDHINGLRAPWKSKPWVWCVSFKRSP